MSEYTPAYMADCPECSAQSWAVDSLTEEFAKVKCGSCGVIDSYSLSPSEMGVDCLFCQHDVWEVVEYDSGEHLMLKCESCEEIVEVWLRDD